MPISITGTGTITGISAGGLPDDCITTAEIAASAVTTAKLAQPMTIATAQASTSGTAIDFTSIPSWVKRVTVMLNEVSTNGTSTPQIQLGTGSTTFATSGYAGAAMNTNGGAVGTSNYTSGLIIQVLTSATGKTVGHAIFTNVSGNIWVGSLNCARTDEERVGIASTVITLGAVLTGVRITTVNGTDTFDAGSVNILYEG